MTDDLREAVARALCLSFYGTQWEAMPAFSRGICYDMADAALAALGIPLETLSGLRDGSMVASDAAEITRLRAEVARLREALLDHVMPYNVATFAQAMALIAARRAKAAEALEPAA